ncbi:MAG: DUF3048 domain-containing protein [Candidatus Moranbacteria bacterium]|jgi:hypothetical protein|nr:DUF3048 domain-containing protein [Candidatus Moranbacteria bacterium]MDD5651958.1 DUF3048 domain-containing protein [Candidatus Moranbacteria bacterium]MDX9855899.1 DUF3048 domain-containing protein [Candidatus Moranbacteria bacterium]
MSKKQKIVAAVGLVLIAGIIIYSTVARDAIRKKRTSLISTESSQESGKAVPLNEGNLSPISGLACDNWDKRPIAIMQPADMQARPAAGFSQADMVIEMPGFTASVTRLMGIYICDIPDEAGAIRSSRHDYIHLAKGLDAVFIHWGGSIFALEKLKGNIIDHIDCMVYSGKYCHRWDWANISGMRMEDSGHVTRESVLQAMDDLNFRKESQFNGYPHQAEAPLEERPGGGNLRVAFAKPYDVEYDYDKETNSYLRTWGDTADTDRNNGKRLAPKNVVVMIAESEQISLNIDYAGRGVENPWDMVPENKKTGSETINFRYNDVNVGDPWFDTKDSGKAYYYMNGKEYQGSWKKDKSDIGSKLFFYDENGEEVMFVPGQIWVEILEPGQVLRWEPIN